MNLENINGRLIQEAGANIMETCNALISGIDTGCDERVLQHLVWLIESNMEVMYEEINSVR